MKKSFVFILMGVGVLMFSACSAVDEEVEMDHEVVDDMQEPPPLGDEPTAVNPGGFHPSDMYSYIFTSEDGLTWEKRNEAVHGSVPHMIQSDNGDLIATFQYFAGDDKRGVMAYASSSDLGVTWSEPVVLDIVDLPGTVDQKTSQKPSNPLPVDPTLAQLEDGRFRIYFTYHEIGFDRPGPHSAVADSMDGEFEYEGPLFRDEDYYILDPAVVYFDGLWHYYTASIGQNAEREKDDNYVAYHAVSEDGVEFELEEMLDLDFSMLGGAVVVGDGLRFYGSDPAGRSAGYSADGYEWEALTEAELRCSDPGVVYLEDSDSYLMICQVHGEK
jgi:hypothetical protein